VDSAGDIFVTETGNSTITVIPKNSGIIFGQQVQAGQATTLNAATGLSGLSRLSFNQAGDLFIANGDNNTITVIPKNSGIIFGQQVQADEATTLNAATGLNDPYGLAVNPSGDLFYVNSGSSITVIAKNSGIIFGQQVQADEATTLNAAKELNGPLNVSFDSAGNLYCINNGVITVIPKNSGIIFGQQVQADQATTLNAAAGIGVIGIAFDDTGDLYIGNGNSVAIIPQDSGTIFGQQVQADQATTLNAATGLNGPTGLAFDSVGNLYVVNAGDNDIEGISANQSLITGSEQGGAPNGFENLTTCSTSNPVNCATGDFWHTFTDINTPSLGIPLVLSRTYNSDEASNNGPFGYGWTDNLSMSLSFASSGEVTVDEGNGSQVFFTSTGNGQFTAPSRVLASLVQNSNGIYTLTDARSRVKYTFSSAGQLMSEEPLNGEETTFTYNSLNELSKVTDPSGRSLVFTYGPNGDISSVTDPMGRVTSYTYDSAGNLISATDPMGKVESFTYNSSHLLLTMTDPNGGTLTNTYDSSGRVVAQTDPMGQTTKFSYSGNPASLSGSTTVITDPNGNVTTHTYEDMELTSVTKGTGASAARWDYTYNPFTLGIETSTDPNGNTTHNTYNSSGDLISSTNALGDTTNYSYNSLNEVTCMSLPLAPTSCSQLSPPAPISPPLSSGITIAPPSVVPPPYVTYNEYDTNGNLIFQTTGAYAPGSTTASSVSTTYDLYNNESATIKGVTDSCNKPAPSSSLPCATINPNGVMTQLSYDKYGDLLTASTPNGNLSSVSTNTFAYNVDGELTSNISPNGNIPGANAANFTTSYSYNADGELTTSTQGSSGASITPRVTQYTYDNNGNNTSASQSLSPYFVGANSVATPTGSATTANTQMNLSFPPGSSSGDEALLALSTPLPRPEGLSDVAPGNIVDYVGNGSYGSSGIGGPAVDASLNAPYSVASDNSGDIALADRNNSVIDFVPASSGTYFGQYMKADAIYRVAGNGTYGSSGIGGPAVDASLNGPGAVALDGAGNLFIADTDNSTVDMVPNVSGTYFGQSMISGDIYVVAGNGSFYHSGIGGPAVNAALDGPSALAVSSNDNLFISDTNNNVVDMVPNVPGTYFGQSMTSGDIYTVVGNGSYGSSGIGGTAVDASLNTPTGLGVDQAGNLFVSDHNNNVVDMVPNVSGTYFGQSMTSGDIYRVAGNGTAGYSGNSGLGTSAELNGPGGLAISNGGNLVIADTYNSKIRVVDETPGTYFGQSMTSGDIYTIAGEGGVGNGGDNQQAISSQLDGPSSVATDLGGDIFISDLNNDVIRAIASSSSGPAPTIPTGFSYLTSTWSGDQKTYLYKALVTTTSTSVAIDDPYGIDESATLGVFGDINTVNPIDALSVGSSNALSSGSTTESFPALSLKNKDDLLVAAIATRSIRNNDTGGTWQLPHGFGDLSSKTSSTTSPVTYTDMLSSDSELIQSNTVPKETVTKTASSSLTGIELALAPGNATSATKTTYNADNEPVMTTDTAGQSSLTCYDGDGNVVETVPPIGVAENSLTTSSCALSTLYPNGILSSSGSENLPIALASDATLTSYNSLGEKTQLSTPPPAGETNRSVVTYKYDLAGNLIETITPPVSNTTGAVPITSTYTYNSGDELLSATTAIGTPAASTTSYCYDQDGNEVISIPGDGNTQGIVTCNTSDPLSGQVQNSSGMEILSPYQSTYVYNSVGELIKEIRPATSTSSSGTITTYTYDPAGNKLTTTIPSGTVITNTYTPQNQVASTTYSDNTPAVGYTYDPSGQMTTMKDGTGTSTYTYDPFGELLSATNANNQTISYSYNSLGEQTSLTYPLPGITSTEVSPTITYGYDLAGNISDVSDFSGNAATIAYNQDNLATTTNLAQSFGVQPAASITATYDLTDQPMKITVSNSSKTNLSFSYTRTPTGAIAQETGTPSSSATPSNSYTYDSIGRITEVSSATASPSYNYDQSGNLLTLPNGQRGTYNYAGELTSSTSPATTTTPQVSTTYAYNANGDRTSSSNGMTATYNGANELTSYQNQNVAMTSATYNGLGQRVSADFTSSTTGIKANYLYDPNSNLLMDQSNAYIYDGSTTAPFEQINLQTGNITYLITDALGSVRGVLSSSGTLEATTSYSAYGTPATTGGLSNFTPFGFAGSYMDPTGLIYLINRYYDPTTGQFLSVDPLVSLTQTPYGYAGGDPVNGVDPSGLRWCWGVCTFTEGAHVIATGVVTTWHATTWSWDRSGGILVHGVYVGAVGSWHFIYNNASNISTLAAILAEGALPIPGVGEIASPIFGAISVVTGAIAADQAAQKGDYLAAALDSLNSALGATSLLSGGVSSLLENAAVDAWDAGNLELVIQAAHGAEDATQVAKITNYLSLTETALTNLIPYLTKQLDTTTNHVPVNTVPVNTVPVNTGEQPPCL
jgi:RHS repeat-associated protein